MVDSLFDPVSLMRTALLVNEKKDKNSNDDEDGDEEINPDDVDWAEWEMDQPVTHGKDTDPALPAVDPDTDPALPIVPGGNDQPSS